MSRIVVTGIGIVSAIGNNADENLKALRNNVCGMSHLDYLQSKYASLLPFGEIKQSNSTLKSKFKLHAKGITRTTLLALQAADECIQSAKLSASELQSNHTALIGASTVGGMCLTDEMYADANAKSGGSDYLTSYDFASVHLFLHNYFKIGGINNTINTACSSSANAIIYGANLIKQGFAKRAIVGGSDSLAKFTINGFNALNILSKTNCKPFDKNRSGLNLGEGAAYLVLEKAEDCKGKTIYADLSGYANTNDAYHPSSLSEYGDGPYLAMQQALKSASLQASQIDYINAHGTGTENNDLVEGMAMKRLFEKVPDFSSTKSNTGHTLAAASAIEAVYSIFSLMHQEVYKSLNFNETITETRLTPVSKYHSKNISHVLSNSFGFGGNCSSLVFSKH